MNGISVERGAISERGYEARVVRAGQKQRVGADRKRLHFGNERGQRAQSFHVFLARRLFHVGTVLPDHDVCQHNLCLFVAQPSPRTALSSLIRSPIASPANSTLLARQTTRGGFSCAGEPLTITNSSPYGYTESRIFRYSTTLK